ncbi:hypothetical protein A6U86_05595 [Rhizobium sp. AC27/96]|uniref:hypothetical protein n=1 Tax=Rhizobium sp. AC27/96 TaxID=1841653 RepID=UPI0008282FD6|nr:hypothetical protein [Rhizobium sp. AC27/96]OCJ12496.1 hypothetical protein A6U86_05595 [Rhizobium sp. AC27/96]
MSTVAYPTFDAWMDEIEGYSTRWERFLSDHEEMASQRAIDWVREAWNLGYEAGKALGSDRQYLEKIASQVIARNQTETAEAPAKKLDGGSSAASRGAGGVASACPALIDDVGSGA